MGRSAALLCLLSSLALFAACSKSSGDDAGDDGSGDGGTAGSSSGSSGKQGSSSGGQSSGSINPTTDTPVADGPPRVSYIGRTDLSDADAPRIGWSGTRVIVRFEGTALSVDIDEEEISDGGSRYDIALDGKSITTLALESTGLKTYDIVKDLPAGTHVVTMTRRTEAQVGVSQFKAFHFPNGGKLLAPPIEPARRIEFVGDSEMVGYGIECQDKTAGFSAATENELLTYPELAATTLHAEMHNLGFSGKGVYRNGLPGGERYGAYYPRAVPRAEAVAWDFTTWKPDVIWVALGANDYDNGGDDTRPPPTFDHFKGAYSTLLDTIRGKNPDAKIVLVLQSFVNDIYPAGYNGRTNIRNALTQLVAERGDANLFFAELPEAKDEDLTGCDSHPNPGLHQKLAPIVSAKIAEITGWK
jgi:lysophospholipase L1-like esterase